MKPLEAIIKSGHGENLRRVVEELTSNIADVRIGDYSAETRKCAISVIEAMLLEKIRLYSQKTNEKGEDNWK